MLTWKRARIYEPLPQSLVEDLIDQRALAGSGSAGNRNELAQRKPDIDRFQVVFARSANRQMFAVSLAPVCRRANGPLTGKELAGRRVGTGQHFLQSSLDDYSS